MIVLANLRLGPSKKRAVRNSPNSMAAMNKQKKNSKESAIASTGAQSRPSWFERTRDSMIEWVLGPDGQMIFLMAMLIGGILVCSRLYPTPPSAPPSEYKSQTYWEKRETAEMRRFLEGKSTPDYRDDLQRIADGDWVPSRPSYIEIMDGAIESNQKLLRSMTHSDWVSGVRWD